jgi:hypothetical protein
MGGAQDGSANLFESFILALKCAAQFVDALVSEPTGPCPQQRSNRVNPDNRNNLGFTMGGQPSKDHDGRKENTVEDVAEQDCLGQFSAGYHLGSLVMLSDL